MKAYAEKVLVDLKEKSEGLLQDDLQEGVVVSVGHMPIGENDPLKEGDNILIESKAQGIPVTHEGNTLYLFRKHQILIIK